MTIIAGKIIDPSVLSGISKAAKSQKVDFSFLMAQAARESSFNPKAKATKSSATGLYQFIEQTWLGVFKKHGAEIGEGGLANQIQTKADGRHYVKDPEVRKHILDLRQTPEIAAQLAAAHAVDNKAFLEKRLGREVKNTDLYLAHLLGPTGAVRFLNQLKESGNAKAIDFFPQEAKNNKGIFYNKAGEPKALKQIYASLDQSIAKDMKNYAYLEPGNDLRGVQPLQNRNIIADRETAPSLPPVDPQDYAMDSRIWTQLHATQNKEQIILKALELSNAPYLS